MIRLTIDGKPAEMGAGATILDAAKAIGVEIPTLCFLPPLHAERGEEGPTKDSPVASPTWKVIPREAGRTGGGVGCRDPSKLQPLILF